MVWLLKLLLVFIFWAGISVNPQQIYAEEISSFDVSAAINPDGSVDIAEKITYEFGSLERHGIFREMPLIKENSAGKKFRIGISEISVDDNAGDIYRFTQKKSADKLEIKIGDPDRTVSGQRIYRISYKVNGALSYFSDHDELYWNVTGNDWPVSIRQAQITISLPGNPENELVRLRCFTGSTGSDLSDCLTDIDPGRYSVTSGGGLSAVEGLTVVLGFPKGIAAVMELEEVVDFFETAWGRSVKMVISVLLLIGTAIWYAGVPLFIIYKWFSGGRDPKPTEGQPHVWFDVPKTKSLRPLSPGETGTLIDEQADMRDITATVVDLARRGYLRIVEKKKNDFYFEKSRLKPEADLEPHEKKLYHGFFNNRDEVRVKDGNFVTTVNVVKNSLYQAVVREGFFEKNPQTVRTTYIIIGTVAFVTLNIPLAIIAFLFGWHMPRKTLSGAQASNIARALKTFLSSQDHQLEYQAKNQLFFEKMLPYAVAFGVEKIWADRFKDIALSQPEWYQGYHAGTFNSILLTKAIGSSLADFSSSATPVRSSRGFSSGFSGGFSGGGGGGGGGGSW